MIFRFEIFEKESLPSASSLRNSGASKRVVNCVSIIYSHGYEWFDLCIIMNIAAVQDLKAEHTKLMRSMKNSNRGLDLRTHDDFFLSVKLSNCLHFLCLWENVCHWFSWPFSSKHIWQRSVMMGIFQRLFQW